MRAKQMGVIISGRAHLDERHVVRDTCVVDEHAKLLAGAHIGNRLHTGMGAEQEQRQKAARQRLPTRATLEYWRAAWRRLPTTRSGGSDGANLY